MRRPAAVLALCVLAALAPGTALGDIFEFADEGGKVVYYKYTNRGGSVVFTDTLDAIPAEDRRGAKIVRKTVPGGKGGGAAKPQAAAPASPKVPEWPMPPVQPAAPPPEAGNAGGGSPFPVAAVAVALLVAAVAAGLVFAAKKRSAAPPRTASRGRDPVVSEADDAKAEIQKRLARKDFKGAAELCESVGKLPEAALLFAQGGDFASAARINVSLGNLEKAAANYREGGDLRRAAEVHAGLHAYRAAAELFEKAGDPLGAAENYALAYLKEGGARGAATTADARRSGELFEGEGRLARALEIYLKAGLFAEAAAVSEKTGDEIAAAEYHLKVGETAAAEACIERSGDAVRGNALLAQFYRDKGMVREAAACAEKAGDLSLAAEQYQEAGEPAKAGDLYRQAGFLDDAAECYLAAGESARAAEVFMTAGKYLQAARAYEKLGTEPARVAELYEKGGDWYAAGRLHVKIGQMDRALNALQQVDAGAEDFRRASLLIGMIFLKKKMTGLAAEKFAKIIDGQPLGKSNLDPYYFLALCHEASGEPEKARAIFEKILIEDFGFRDVKKRLGA